MDTAVSLLEKPLLTTTDVTDTLAQAFYYQDARMDALLQGDYVQAQYFEQQAGALMALNFLVCPLSKPAKRELYSCMLCLCRMKLKTGLL